LSETVLLTPWKAYHPLEGKETRYFHFYHAAERPFRLSQMLDDCLALVFDSLSCFAGHCIFSILNKQNKSRNLTVNGSSILSATQRTTRTSPLLNSKLKSKPKPAPIIRLPHEQSTLDPIIPH
jgi:hypothetical protein